jgi:endonuclease/exonuclease/phosphatase (EEP) superfamily protein YafD
MDRHRVRRARQWLLGNAPRSAVRVGDRLRIVPIEGFALLFLAMMLLVTLVLHTVADRWWPATVLLFLGRWPWLLPGIPILALAVGLAHRRAIVTTLAAGIVALFGVLKMSPGLGRVTATAGAATQVRVISFNIGGTMVAPMSLVAMMAEWQPDILAVQECGETSVEQLRGMPTYYHDVGTTCLFTRFPILRVDSLRRDAFRNAQGAAWVKRYRLQGPDGAFDFTNLHLDTPRKGFEAMMDGRDDATTTIAEKTEIRDLESRLARRWADLGPGPRLVAGDFNMPTESAIYRRHWSSMTNGFSQAGRGFGYTRRAGWIQLRIDHVLADDGWVVQAARLLPDYGSDHRPMMVDVAYRTR